MERPLISIALCTFNGETYLKDQIDSILNQSYKNIEIIIVDDCSMDKSKDIIKGYIKNYDCIKFYENEINLGLIKNFQKAITLCCGEYIALSDQDDIWEYDKLEKQFSLMKENNFDLVYCDSLLIDENSNSLNMKLSDNMPNYTCFDNLYLIFNNGVAGHAILFKNYYKKMIIPFPDDIQLHDMWISFIFLSYGKIGFINLPLVKYRIHKKNLTKIGLSKNKKNYEEKINSKIISIEKQCVNLKNYIFYLKNNLPNHINLPIFEELYFEYSLYKDYYFNFKLFKLLNNQKNRLFFRKKDMVFFKLLKMSVGVKLFKLLPFL